jgi:hypothetical protein
MVGGGVELPAQCSLQVRSKQLSSILRLNFGSVHKRPRLLLKCGHSEESGTALAFGLQNTDE